MSDLPGLGMWMTNEVFQSMPLPYGRLLHPRPALTNCKSCRTQHWELPQDAHKTQTYSICMTKHSHFPYIASTAPRLTIQTENTTSITYTTQTNNILQHSKAQKTLFLTTAATQQTFPQTHTVTTTNIKYIHLLSLCI